ncbi:unnamed protein product [Closterium sp. Yama58-4]|nr:unnamed protein product [Closterium sp. Yama58-4]
MYYSRVPLWPAVIGDRQDFSNFPASFCASLAITLLLPPCRSLHNNQLTGSIPAEICNMTKLVFLVPFCLMCFCLSHVLLPVSCASACLMCFCLPHVLLPASCASACLMCFCLPHVLLPASCASVFLMCFCLPHVLLLSHVKDR